MIAGEKQAAVHHDQWNAASTNYREACGSLFTVLTTIHLFLRAYSSPPTTYLLWRDHTQATGLSRPRSSHVEDQSECFVAALKFIDASDARARSLYANVRCVRERGTFRRVDYEADERWRNKKRMEKNGLFRPRSVGDTSNINFKRLSIKHLFQARCVNLIDW